MLKRDNLLRKQVISSNRASTIPTFPIGEFKSRSHKQHQEREPVSPFCDEASCSFAPIVTFSLWPELGRIGARGLPAWLQGDHW